MYKNLENGLIFFMGILINIFYAERDLLTVNYYILTSCAVREMTIILFTPALFLNLKMANFLSNFILVYFIKILAFVFHRVAVTETIRIYRCLSTKIQQWQQ